MTDFLSKIADYLGKLVAFRGGNPFKSQPFWVKADEPDKFLHHRHPLGRNKIAFPIMALSDVAAGNKNTVRPFLECLQNKMGRHPTAAHHTDR